MYDPARWMSFLSEAMRDADITGPADLCRRLGVNHSVYSRWESENRQPSNSMLRKLAPVLGVSVRTLLVESGHFEPYELVGGDDALNEILASDKLNDRAKLELIGEWRREERAREHRFIRFIETLLARVDRDPEESSPLP
ncbi:helix-turn-helix domain-containing protein [Actinomadura sp. 9N215]|uniref:helix-turn-helix domain-containing protein n=1 Tax=Actinomadura sp. 9N215 TaxID=3375150 RepID=UPI0037B5D82B